MNSTSLVAEPYLKKVAEGFSASLSAAKSPAPGQAMPPNELGGTTDADAYGSACGGRFQSHCDKNTGDRASSTRSADGSGWIAKRKPIEIF
ncbi:MULTISPECIES: hypothetical protein [unclassified Rhizobium]|uniref:hypothetical protein n=1 Tax=unclassified Rhizobium TaxID=2613769 RepID=UPI0012E3AAFA|nr:MULTISPECIES: hypothetical protein [unclassified Rhizobium]